MTGLRRALVALAVAGFALGLGALALVLTSSTAEGTKTPFIVLALTLGWSFIGAGLIGWWQRPEHRIGPMMTLVGFTWFLGALAESGSAWVYTVGNALSSLWIGAFVQLLVAFPSGRIAPGFERRLVRAGWLFGLFPPLLLLVTARPDDDCDACPANKLLVWDSTAASHALQIVFAVLVVALLGGVCLLLVRRWRSSGTVQRAALTPVLGTGALTAAVGLTGVVAEVAGLDAAGPALELVLLVLVTAVPFAFLVGLLRSRLSRAGAVSALVERLAGVSVRDTLADALGDPTLTLAYWLPRPGRYVDADGHPAELPAPGAERAATEIVRDGVPVAAIIHDAALLEEPELVRSAGAAAALLLENERLDAELRARYDELRASRARLVAAGDAARRRLERDLHDGAQQRFVALALKLRLARNALEPETRAADLLDEGMAELALGLAELRELARGLHPAVLTERGLAPAVSALAARSPVPAGVTCDLPGRLPPDVEIAVYFVVAEALTNVAKYAEAQTVDVLLERTPRGVLVEIHDDGVGGADPSAGSGLSGIADRVAALDGELHVESPPGGGTHLSAEIPCPAGGDGAPPREPVPAAGARA